MTVNLNFLLCSQYWVFLWKDISNLDWICILKSLATTVNFIFLFHVIGFSAAESLKAVMLSEEKAVKEFSYTVSGVLSSSNHFSTSRSENLKELIDGAEKYVIYKFNIRYKLSLRLLLCHCIILDNYHLIDPSVNYACYGISAESGKGDIIPCPETRLINEVVCSMPFK